MALASSLENGKTNISGEYAGKRERMMPEKMKSDFFKKDQPADQLFAFRKTVAPCFLIPDYDILFLP